MVCLISTSDVLIMDPIRPLRSSGGDRSAVLRITFKVGEEAFCSHVPVPWNEPPAELHPQVLSQNLTGLRSTWFIIFSLGKCERMGSAFYWFALLFMFRYSFSFHLYSCFIRAYTVKMSLLWKRSPVC